MKDKLLHFKYLPEYADFLLKNKLKDFTSEQINIMKDMDVPVLKFFSHFKEEQLLEEGQKNTQLFLEAFKSNSVSDYIQISIDNWISNQYAFFTRENISIEDITLISFTRRKLFRHFLSDYTQDSSLSLKIMEEVDAFTVEIDTRSFNLMFDMQYKLYEQVEVIAHIGSWSWDLRNNHMIWSREMFRIYELEPVENANIYDRKKLIHPEDLAKSERELERSIKSNIPYSFTYRLVLKSGVKHLLAKGQPEVDAENKVIKVFGTLQDITEQKRIRDELKRNEELVHGMVNEIQDYAIILLDTKGTILNWNKGAEKIKGYSSQEIVGKNFRIFYTEKDLEEGLPEMLLNKAIQEGRATHEGWRKRKNGSIFWGSIVITALHDKEGNVIGFSKITRELTERKLAEDQLMMYSEKIEMKNKKLEQANKELESFSYIASHDLQEPLRKIQAFTSRLLQKENDNLSEWGKDVFSKVQTSANRMQRLIEALLSFSRLDKAQDAYEHVDINHLLEEVKINLNEIIIAKKATIVSEPLPVFQVIPIQFQQLLTNLISNALKYSKPDVAPIIKITYGMKEGKLIPGNSIHDKNKYHHLTFSDNGIGFDPQYSEKIFELFQRLHGKSEYEGTGIGLAICKKIVDNHHGFINATAEPNNGAEFNVYIPSERNAEVVTDPNSYTLNE
jgi:PAS domain S-box-containing protein